MSYRCERKICSYYEFKHPPLLRINPFPKSTPIKALMDATPLPPPPPPPLQYPRLRFLGIDICFCKHQGASRDFNVSEYVVIWKIHTL